MKIIAASVLALGLGRVGQSAAHANPLAARAHAPAPPRNPNTDAGGGGPGWHRGPYGGCRPMYNCPLGWHSGPFGRHCFRNW